MSNSSNFSNYIYNPNNKFDSRHTLDFMYQKTTADSTKFFLECYHASANTFLLSKKFMEESPLYSKESLVPELYEILGKPYNRNLAFYIRHGPHSGYNKSHQFFNNVKPNFFPKLPIILSPFCELEMKTHNIFAKNFEVTKVEEEIKDQNKFNNENNKQITELKLEDIFGEDYKQIDRINPFNNFMKHNLYDIKVRIPGKMWQFKLTINDKFVIYGPYLTDFVYNFLKEVYFPNKKKGLTLFGGATLLITDTESDIHYLPEMLMNLLDEEKNKNKKEDKKEDIKEDKKEDKKEEKDNEINIINTKI